MRLHSSVLKVLKCRNIHSSHSTPIRVRLQLTFKRRSDFEEFCNVYISQGFQPPISDGGAVYPCSGGGTSFRWGGTLRASRRANREIFLKIYNFMLFLLGNNIQVYVSNTILLCILS